RGCRAGEHATRVAELQRHSFELLQQRLAHAAKARRGRDIVEYDFARRFHRRRAEDRLTVGGNEEVIVGRDDPRPHIVRDLVGEPLFEDGWIVTMISLTELDDRASNDVAGLFSILRAGSADLHRVRSSELVWSRSRRHSATAAR